MRKLIVVISLVAAPLVAAAPAAATAGPRAAVSSAAAVVTAGRARDGMAHPPSAPPVPQVRDAATPRESADTRPAGQTATLLRHDQDGAGHVSALAAAPAGPAARASAGSALARAPPVHTQTQSP
jgi:hypothetical protein